jgi:hypothetical protein
VKGNAVIIPRHRRPASVPRCLAKPLRSSSSLRYAEFPADLRDRLPGRLPCHGTCERGSRQTDTLSVNIYLPLEAALSEMFRGPLSSGALADQTTHGSIVEAPRRMRRVLPLNSEVPNSMRQINDDSVNVLPVDPQLWLDFIYFVERLKGVTTETRTLDTNQFPRVAPIAVRCAPGPLVAEQWRHQKVRFLWPDKASKYIVPLGKQYPSHSHASA